MQRRGWASVNRCFLLGKDDTCDHILLHCEITRSVREIVFFPLWCGLGVFFHCQRGVPKLARFLCGEDMT